MKILITGSAGFIGAALSIQLLEEGFEVMGIDNHNDYYDVALKEARLQQFLNHPNYKHFRAGIEDKEIVYKIFSNVRPDVVVNLAAQAGVGYSLVNPHSYVESNIMGFLNILEACKDNNVKHLIYASSSSVYGANTEIPFSTLHSVDHPISLYAASKRANELMAHTYSDIYGLPTTGLRFFTVYGPWGRPDMALFKFTKSIVNDETINVNNNGNHSRDFTYIDDTVSGIKKMITGDAPSQNDLGIFTTNSSKAPWKIYNIGNNNPTHLIKFIELIEKYLNKKAKINFVPLQPGDVQNTYADVDDLIQDYGYKPDTNIENGIKKFIDWYKLFYNVK